MKSDRKWGADPVRSVGNYKVSEDRGRVERVLIRVECSSHLIVNRMHMDTCETCTFTGWGSGSEMEFRMQDISDASESTPIEVGAESRSGKREKSNYDAANQSLSHSHKNFRIFSSH